MFSWVQVSGGWWWWWWWRGLVRVLATTVYRMTKRNGKRMRMRRWEETERDLLLKRNTNAVI
jgi:hypothetical protein